MIENNNRELKILMSMILGFPYSSKKLTFGGDAPFTGFLFCEGVPGFGNETSG